MPAHPHDAGLGATIGGRPLRILLVTARYLPERGGTEVHTHQVATRLAARGAQVTVVTTMLRKPMDRESVEGGIRVLRVRAWPPNRDYYLAPAIARIVRRGGADIVHCQGYHTLVAPLVMAAALSSRVPYVVTLHSGGHSSLLRRLGRPTQARLLRPLLRRAQALVAASRFEAELFARRLRLPTSAFVVIPSGVDLPPAPAGPSAAEDHPLVLSVGRLESYKGHHRLVEALPAILASRPGLRLRIVGTGPLEPKLLRLADRLGVADHVEVAPVPAQDRSEMAGLLRQASVVALLSQYESQGLAAQEAMALGRPVAVTRATALGDLEGEANVSAVSPDAGPEEVAAVILGLLDASPAEPPEMPTWEGCVNRLVEVYRDVLGTTG